MPNPTSSLTWGEIVSTVNSDRRVSNDYFYNLGGASTVASPSEGAMTARRINNRIASMGDLEFMASESAVTLDSSGNYTIIETDLPGFMKVINVFYLSGTNYVYLGYRQEWDVKNGILNVTLGQNPPEDSSFYVQWTSRYLVRDGTTGVKKRDFIAAADYWVVPEAYSEVMFSGLDYYIGRKEMRPEDKSEAKGEYSQALVNMHMHTPEVFTSKSRYGRPGYSTSNTGG